MTIQLDRVAEVTITRDNVAGFLRDGFRFEANVPAEQLAEKIDEFTAACGFGYVLVGPVAKLCDGMPWPEWHDGTLFSIYLKRPEVPAQRTR